METLPIDYENIYIEFANTEYGERLLQSVRWEKYNIGNLSNEEWCRLLGDDANNLRHMRVMYDLTNQFIERQNANGIPIDPDSAMLLSLSAIIHDQAEAITGDISYGDKSKQDESQEIRAFESHLDAMNPKMNSLTKQMAKSAIRGVIFDPFTPEGAAFNAIERTGYLITALHAASHVEIVQDPATKRGLHWLVTDVLLNQTTALIESANSYSLPRELLVENAARISQIFATTPEEVFDQYGEDKIKKQNDFTKAQQTWATFCASNGL